MAVTAATTLVTSVALRRLAGRLTAASAAGTAVAATAVAAASWSAGFPGPAAVDATAVAAAAAAAVAGLGAIAGVPVAGLGAAMASGAGRAAAAAAASCRPPDGSLPPVLRCCPLADMLPELFCCFWAAFLPFKLPGDTAGTAAEAERCWLLGRGPEPRLPLPPPFARVTGKPAAKAAGVCLAARCSIPIMSSCSDV